MPVTLTTPVVLATPPFSEVHMERLTVDLENTEYARTTITARIRLYYRDPITGLKTFALDHFDINIPDGEAWARELALKGDMRGIAAATEIKNILSLLVSTHTNWGNTTVA